MEKGRQKETHPIVLSLIEFASEDSEKKAFASIRSVRCRSA